MVTKNSLFVDTSGWAYLVDRHDPLHRDVHTVYQHAFTQQRLLVTTNYVLAELVALLSSRSRIPRQQIFMFVDALRVAPHVEIIHISADFDAQAWTLLKARVDKNWSLVDASSFIAEWQTSHDARSFTGNPRDDFTLISCEVCHSAFYHHDHLWDDRSSHHRPPLHASWICPTPCSIVV